MNSNIKLYVVDFSSITSHKEVHPLLAEALDFPDYYGCNWDAFWDCITDMAGIPLHIEIRGLDVLTHIAPRHSKMLCECLKDFKHYEDDYYIDQIHIDIILGDNVISLT